MKPMWKVTFVTRNLLMVGLVPPHSSVRVYHRKWRANLAAFFGSISPIGTPYVRWAVVEPYWPDSNVIPLRRSA